MFNVLKKLKAIMLFRKLGRTQQASSQKNYQDLARLLSTNAQALQMFEKRYRETALGTISDNFFEVNAKQAVEMRERKLTETEQVQIVERIVNELLAQTSWYHTDGKTVASGKEVEPLNGKPVEREELLNIPAELRPQLTGRYMTIDIDAPSYVAVLNYYMQYAKAPNSKQGKDAYNHFRQGLDILDLDPITYKIIGSNTNAMGHWLPSLDLAIANQKFFKIPATTIIQVPLTLLQLTRLDWERLTPLTMAIVDRYCEKAFHLDENKEYFVKTGTFSSKYDFRNAHVAGKKEVHELGEYLLYIHFQALQMASPTSKPCIIGASTTNEWVVREFIQDKEDNPCIYKGMPLHTEYRVFVDFDSQKVIGCNPYWDPDVMKHRFSEKTDADSPHQKHDYIIYMMHEETLMRRYHENVERVVHNIEKMLPDFMLDGQWSIDIMQNGDDFYIIDMARAVNSALLKCVPKELLKPYKEDWLVKLPGLFENKEGMDE